MTKSLEYIIANFKPEFGNEKHIEIAQVIGNIRQKEASLKKEKHSARMILKIADEIEKEERLILFLMKKK